MQTVDTELQEQIRLTELLTLDVLRSRRMPNVYTTNPTNALDSCADLMDETPTQTTDAYGMQHIVVARRTRRPVYLALSKERDSGPVLGIPWATIT